MALKNKVELPEDALTSQMHKSIRMPRITSVSSGGTDSHGRKRFYVHVVQPAEHAQDELPTILTATSRNSSFMAGIGVVDIHAPTLAVPRFSIDGVYDCIGASKDCPLIAFATKPVGNTSQQLASRAYAAVRGGFDIVNDDDKVANPCSTPFHERVQAIASAVRQASEGTGKTALYFANINAPVEYLKQRAYDAKAFLTFSQYFHLSVFPNTNNTLEVRHSILKLEAIRGANCDSPLRTTYMTGPHINIDHVMLRVCLRLGIVYR